VTPWAPIVNGYATMKEGPYVDKIVVKQVQSDQWEDALLAGEGETLDTLLWNVSDELRSDPDISIEEVALYGYTYLSLNCLTYPLNISRFRRALALSIDRTLIAEVLNESVFPLYSSVPQTDLFSAEESMEILNSIDVDAANEMLDALGFAVDPLTGFRKTPSGSNLTLNVEIDYAAETWAASEVLCDCFAAIHVDSYFYETIFGGYWETLQRLYNHGSYCMALHYVPYTYTPELRIDTEWLVDEFGSDSLSVYAKDLPNFSNASFDHWASSLASARDFDSYNYTAYQLQEIIALECPVIPLWQRKLYSVYRNDVYEGFVNDSSEGVSSFTSARLVHRKDGSPGGTLCILSQDSMDRLNFMSTNTALTRLASDLLYPSLFKRAHNGREVFWLARGYTVENHTANPAVLQGHLRFTFSLFPWFSWSNGSPVTADDVVQTYLMYLECDGNLLQQSVEDIYAIYARNNDVVIEFSSPSFSSFYKIVFLPVLPAAEVIEIREMGWDLWDEMSWVSSHAVSTLLFGGTCTLSDCEVDEFLEFQVSSSAPYEYVSVEAGPAFWPESPPTDIVMREGSGTASVAWNIWGNQKWRYEIFIDGNSVTREWWESTPITFPIDGLSAGVYTFRVEAYDAYEHSCVDELLVTVLPASTTGGQQAPRGLALLIAMGEAAVIVAVGAALLRGSPKGPEAES
jgi:ABC-type transport system substrate-binding protein